MKKLIVLAIVLFAIPASAAQVTLSWDLTTDNPDGYALFQRTFETGGYNYDSPIWDGQNPPVTLTVDDGYVTAFVCRAYKFGPIGLDGNMERAWSADSNEVQFTPEVTPPEQPQNLVVQIILAVINWFKALFA